MNAPTGQLYISGSIPCVICGEQVTQANISRGDVLAGVGKFVYPAHVYHFFDPNTGQPISDYKQNMDRFALSHAIGEGFEMPGLQPELRPLYEEITEQMRNWNHPAFVVRPEQRK